MIDDLLRVYFDPDEIGPDGYPFAWHRAGWARLIEEGRSAVGDEAADAALAFMGPVRMSIKDMIRETYGHRCERCKHPFVVRSGMGEWSPCDERCTHGGPIRVWSEFGRQTPPSAVILGPHPIADEIDGGYDVDAQWRILTVHHLNGVKHDCRWWNLAALCQRCHLTIQAKVHLDRPWDRPHTEWFKPHAAGYYASEGIEMFPSGGEPPREWVMEHMEEILEAHLLQDQLPGFA